ncbi:MAG: trypsin-like peptidase domain-containing protein [Ruminococcus sp.]|nr:trypsin-like peptidase domain-containing protein [Ruminococcus sp.]
MTDDINNSIPDTEKPAENTSQASPYNSYDARRYAQPAAGAYAYSSVPAEPPKKKRRHPVLKSIAFVLCLAIVGVGSVQGYKIYQDHKDKNGFSEYNGSDNTSLSSKRSSADADDDDDGDDEDDAPLPSLIELAAREDAKPVPDIVEDIMPSVVGVSSTFEYTVNSYDFFGWGMGGSSTDVLHGKGTGIIFSEDGYIVTNAHCIYDDSKSTQAGEALEVSVRFSDQSEHDAKIIAYDTDTDIAVLKVNETGLKPAVFGDSNDLRVGELVIAVGNPLGFELFGSVTCGIVSALNRNISVNSKNMNLIQTDAAINEGNSGGPLLNSCGQVIGINSAKMSSSYGSATVEGLGFAIPIDNAKKIVDDLINYNYVKGRPQLGISTVNVTESDSRRYNVPMGAYVSVINEGSCAEKAGMQVRDIITDIEGDTVSSTTQLTSVLNKHKAGDKVKVTVYRNGEYKKLDVTLQEDQSRKNGKSTDRFMPSN